MGSIDIYSENLIPSPQNKSTKLTLFDELLENLNPNPEQDSCPSDCESGISGSENEQPRIRNGLIRIGSGETIYEMVKKKLVSSLGSCGVNALVESIHRNDYTDNMNRARLQSFCIYSRAVGMKCGGNANGKYAWFGASKNVINEINSHGFGFPTSNRTHGQGVYLSPADHPIESVQSAAPDEDGLKHMLLCRVILGKTEAICPGSEQYNPSSEEFDSGVDNLESPQKYIIWTSRMNTHILPEFVVTLRAFSVCRGPQRTAQHPKQPNSDWMPFPTLITALQKFLPSDAVELIKKHHSDFRKQKITRYEMIQRVRHIAGDKLLMIIIKSYRGKVCLVALMKFHY
ncbi:probable inactive poly [ADP-ribose] polymerase sro5 [Phtheirospermum japonicum]|uniref:Probable inactive poly [ADP-ribose] polymerase sro5 n=1 Tax=Phtheirospermum japonicum TaxID=374723 RepID=A0A830BCX6_9LAMI|nr:probable inactive poly [ADP-ribose] polymerase sro5 [Phtheirospermum japonicum]